MKRSHLDEILVKHPEVSNGGKTAYFSFEGAREHAQISASIARISYKVMQNFPLFETTSLDLLHPASPEGMLIVGKLDRKSVGRTRYKFKSR